MEMSGKRGSQMRVIFILKVVKTEISHSNDEVDSVQFFIYLHAELNSQWTIIESSRIQATTAVR
jgi:hypothetical protein